MATRAEINLRRLLRRCEAMLDARVAPEMDERRFRMYLAALPRMLEAVQEESQTLGDGEGHVPASKDALKEYARKIAHLSAPKETPGSRMRLSHSPYLSQREKNAELASHLSVKGRAEKAARRELLETERESLFAGVTPVDGDGGADSAPPGDVEKLVGEQTELHEQLATDLLEMAASLKDRSQGMRRIIQTDTSVLSETESTTDANLHRLGSENTRVEAHIRAATRSTIALWIMLVTAAVLFCLVFFAMRIFPK